ncbi:MAG: glycosyltransferase family 2 protein [Lautropia sp.]|nr:glycosyltransferase family 2 protein [Lautropia sp.]
MTNTDVPEAASFTDTDGAMVPDGIPASARAATQTPAPSATRHDAAGITAVVVTYNPEPGLLTELCRLTRPQVEHIELVDNGSCPEALAAIEALCTDGIRLTALGRNLGIGAAQNAGIARARKRGADYVLLLDHDSLPAPDMVARLRAAIENQPPDSAPVGAAGPRYADERQTTSPSPFVRLEGFRRIRCECAHENDQIEVEHLIASGSLIPMAVLNRVGDMDEALFIDYVDIEWCLRASHAGHRMLGICDARMQHQLGETPIRFLGKHLPDHSPIRHYYLFRNALLLQRMPHIPLRWKLVDGWQTVMKFGFYALVATPRWPRIRMMARGLLDGLRGRGGAFQRADDSQPR